MLELFQYLSQMLGALIYQAIEPRIPAQKKAEMRQAMRGLSTLLLLGLAFLVFEFFQGSFKLAELAVRAEAFQSAVKHHPYRVVAVLTLIAFVLGDAAFSLKQKNQSVYGSIEVIFGIWSCSFTLSHTVLSSLLAKAIVVISTGYLIARGLNNIEDGKRKAPAIPLAWEAALRPKAKS